MAEQADIVEVMKRSDALYQEAKLDESFDLLTPYTEGTTDNPQMLWMLVRMYYRKSKEATNNKLKEASKRLANKGLDISKKAMEIGSEDFLCWKWAGIILSTHSGLIGIMKKLQAAPVIKGYFEKAHELRPEDTVVSFLLGRWHFNVAEIPRAVRLVSNVCSSTYEEALTHFETAERFNQEEFILNWLYLGKTYYQLKNKPEAKKWLTKVMEHSLPSPDAKESKEEAGKLLKKL